MTECHQTNQAAFQASKDELAKRFPKGHFVASDEGQLIADAVSFDTLTDELAAINKDRPDVFVAQVGIEYPDEVFIQHAFPLWLPGGRMVASRCSRTGVR